MKHPHGGPPYSGTMPIDFLQQNGGSRRLFSMQMQLSKLEDKYINALVLPEFNRWTSRDVSHSPSLFLPFSRHRLSTQHSSLTSSSRTVHNS